MKNVYKILRLLIISMLLLIPLMGHSQVEIVGTLSNFDAHYMVDSLYADNLELDFCGPIDSSDILDWYWGPMSWGNDPRIRNFPKGYLNCRTSGVEVTWMDHIRPIRYCESRHFGLRLNKDLPFDSIGVQAYWTRIQKVAEIPFPLQVWYSEGDTLWDIIFHNYYFPEVVSIQRWYTRLKKPISLEDMIWDNKQIEWKLLDEKPRLLAPGETLDYPFAMDPDYEAYLVKYTVSPFNEPEQKIIRFISMAAIEYGHMNRRIYPYITTWLTNFDLHNTYDTPFDNLELDIFYVNCADIYDYYKGDLSWGIIPIVNPFPYGYFSDPLGYLLPGGVEVTWIDRIHPIMPCQTKHFGLELNPYFDYYPYVVAYWTKIEKVAQIPVPWQWWNVDGTNVIDIIRLSETFPNPVQIEREYAVAASEFILLDNLDWNLDLPGGADWIPAGKDKLEPGKDLRLKVPIPSDINFGTVLVRYTVQDLSSENIVTRFINGGEFIDPVKTGMKTDFEGMPIRYWLGQNYPNPFNAETQISFGIPRKEHVSLVIYNALGQHVRTLFDGYKEPGHFTLGWNGRDESGNTVTSGMYFYTLRTKDFVKTKKLLLMK